MRNPLTRSFPAQDIRLHLMEIKHQIRAEALPVQLLRGIVPGRRDTRGGNLLEAVVGLAPERRAPARIQAFYGAIPVPQPLPEPPFARGAEAQIAMAVSQLIVNLPAHHMRVPGKVAGKGSHKAANMLPIPRVGLAIMMPAAEVMPLQLRIQRLNLGRFLDDPGGRSRAGRAQNAVDALRCQDVDHFVQILKMKFPFFGLPLCPREFRHAHNRDAHLPHHARIRPPPLPWPMLGVVVHTKQICHFPLPFLPWFGGYSFSLISSSAISATFPPAVCFTRQGKRSLRISSTGRSISTATSVSRASRS